MERPPANGKALYINGDVEIIEEDDDGEEITTNTNIKIEIKDKKE